MEVKSGGDVPVRGRGGYRQPELRTIPENAKTTRASDLTGCREIKLLTNYVPIKQMSGRTIYKYRVDFEPTVEDKRRRQRLFHLVQSRLFDCKPIYDSANECRSAKRLADKTTIAIGVDNEVTYSVKFTNTGSCTLGFEFLQVYNMQMKMFLEILGFYSPQPGLHVHPNHYDQINQDIMMLRGFRTAINTHDGDKMLTNLEACHKIMQRQNVLQIMAQIMRVAGRNFQVAIKTALTGKLVVTPYSNKKTCYRIEDVDFETKVTDTFVSSNGQPTSYLDYYRTKYNVPIRDLQQPLLKAVHSKDRNREEDKQRTVILVPELCNQAGLTDSQRNDNRLKMDLIRASQVSPENRVKQLQQFLQTFHSNATIRSQLENWGYQYETEPCQIGAHIVPMTRYADGRTCRQPQDKYDKPDDRSADIRVNSLAFAPTIKKLVVITPKHELPAKKQLLEVLKGGFNRIRFSHPEFENMDLPGDAPPHYINAIRSLQPNTTAAIVIMQSQNKEKYDAIKKAASVERGLITQVVTARLLQDQRKAASAAQKIAIQIAAKIGGEPWWCDIPIAKFPIMICGYDTYHDTAKRGRSFGAFVASLNAKFSRWWSKADAHERPEEISTQMSFNMIEAVNAFKKHNSNQPPAKIIIYRDGVGDGQINQVFEVELKKIKEALKEVGNVQLTMVIVNKRIGARFYARTPANNSFFNPPPGTVIDHTVTRAERFDFYLISQSTRQGTVTPTYYNIIHDECGLSPLFHQKLAFKLCLMYYNWAGTVRVPAPCQYAHKLAFLCGEHLHQQPNATLDNYLHFL